MNELWLKKLGSKAATGIAATRSDATVANCLEVFPRNAATDPLFVSGVSGMQVRETRYHDASIDNINNSAGAFIEIGGAAGAAAFANSILKVQVSYQGGEPLRIRKAANAGAAAAANDLFILNRGEGPTYLEISLAVADRLWVRSASVNTVISGTLTMNFIG